MVGTQEDDRRRRRLLRRSTNTAVTAVNRQRTVKKARVCLHCGNWIRKEKLFYNGLELGEAYIHFKSRGMSERQYLKAIERCYPVPRPIPQKEPQGEGSPM